MNKQHIRPLVLGIFRHNNSILVVEGYDKVKSQTFYRPLGGGIEFGEYGSDALIREIREEMQQEIVISKFLGSCENIFVYEGSTGHEIVLMYEATFVNKEIYEVTEYQCFEDDGKPFTAIWKNLDDIKANNLPLYPTALLEIV